MSAALLFGMMHAFGSMSPEAMPPMHRLVLLAYADFAADDGQAWPSAASVGQRTGQAPRTVETCILELKAAGWLKLETAGGGRRATNTYIVRVDGSPVARARQGRHETPRPVRTAPRADTPTATGAVSRNETDRAPCGPPTAPRAGNPAPRADNPIRIRSSEPITESAVAPRPAPPPRVKLEQVVLPGTGTPPPKAPTPPQVFWGAFRELWAAKYRRPYVDTGADGKAVASLAKLATATLERLGKPAELEALARWQVRKFLADLGRIPRPGELGYLEQTCHRLQDLERGLAAYGTPWDRLRASPEIEQVSRPTAHSAACKPHRCVCTMGARQDPEATA